MPAAIEFDEVVKRYGSTSVLNRISAMVPVGQVVGLLGHNGAGKTTLIKLVLGLIRPNRGTIRVLDEEAGSAQGHACIGYLPENVAFYGNLTGRQVLRYLARLKRASLAECETLLERVGLRDAAHRPVSTYSKGMRQRLGLAQAMLGSPDLLLLDEPTTGLDPMATRHFYELIEELKGQGKTVVISSHLLSELEPYIDAALILSQGRLIAQGSISEMRKRVTLPDIISARFCGPSNDFLSQPWIRDLTPRFIEPLVIELDVPPDRKLEVIGRLMEVGSLRDINVRQPGLSQVYAAIGIEKELEHA